MSAFASGDSLTPSTLNRKLSSAVSVGGFSSNTLQAETGSAGTLFINSDLLVGTSVVTVSPMYQRNIVMSSGTTGSLQITVLYLQGSRALDTQDFAALGFFHRDTEVAQIAGVRGAANDEGWLQFATQQSGGSLVARGHFDHLGIFHLLGNSGLSSRATIRGHSDISINGSALFGGEVYVSFLSSAGTAHFRRDGSAIDPSVRIGSDASLGFYRSNASQLALSYGTLAAPTLSAGDVLNSPAWVSRTTRNASGTTATVTLQGEFYFSILSNTTNGAEFGIRSGNTVWRFFSQGVG